MKLIQLELTAFRQYKHRVFDFTDGITTIVGPNGSGKSTIIEALGFALFGSAAIRGTVKDAVCLAGGSLQVDLTFSLGSEYTISRTTTKASLSGEVQAEGTTEVNRVIKELLGMDYQQFCNSFMTNQKALKFLDITPEKRRSTVMSILGLDRILQGYRRAYKDVSEQSALLKGMGNIVESSKELELQIKDNTEQLEVLNFKFTSLQKQYTAYLNYQKNYQRIQQLQSEITQTKRANEILVIDGWKDASERERTYSRAIDDKGVLDAQIEMLRPVVEQMEEEVKQLHNEKVILSCTLIMYETWQKNSLERYTNSHKDYLQLTETINALRIESCYACKRPFDFTDEEKLQRGIELRKAIKLRRKAARKQQKNSIQYRKRSAEVEKLLVDKNEAVTLYEKRNNETKFQRTILNGYNVRYNDFIIPERPTEEQLQLETEFRSLKPGNFQGLEQELKNLAYTEVEDVIPLYNECKASISSSEAILKFLTESLEKTVRLEVKIAKETQKLKLLENTKKALKEYSDVQTTSIAPDLADKSTALMNLLLDKYDSITISEDLQADIYSDGVLIPLLSGGEEDVISLCLRIALSEMISERTGNTLSLLILDEVFSAMDKDKRVLAMDAISNLKSKFPQILVISHIDEIQEMADNQIRL